MSEKESREPVELPEEDNSSYNLPERFRNVKIVVESNSPPDLIDVFRGYYEEKYQAELQYGEIGEEKTEEEIELINEIIERVDLLAQSLGVEAMEFDESRFEIIKAEVWRRWQKNNPEDYENVGGRFDYGTFNIIIPKSVLINEFAQIACHEIAHAKSFNKFRVETSENGENTVTEYQIGLCIIKCEEDAEVNDVRNYALNEVVTDVIAGRVFHDLEEDSAIIAEERCEPHEANAIGAKIGSSFVLAYEQVGEEKFTVSIDRFKGGMCVAPLIRICHELFNNADHDYRIQRDIEDEFIKAYFTGNMHTIVRLVDRTYGKGTFSRLAEAETPEELYHLFNNISEGKTNE